ncbi:MAG TPA: hypothetical protein PKZ07_14375 [Sedimentisphaerales bacterium]|nr:hypothetical protein [Sedimentisphaerales bacterium]
MRKESRHESQTQLGRSVAVRVRLRVGHGCRGQVGGFTLVVDKTSTIYAASDDGFLYVVGSDGAELARFETGGWPAFPVVAADDLLILADSKDYSSLEKGAKNTVWAIGAPAVEQRN